MLTSYLFMYNKNYEELPFGRNLLKPGQSSSSSEEKRYKVFTFNYLFRKLTEYGEDAAEAKARDICKWKLRTTENILHSLLVNNQDQVASEFLSFYVDNADTDLLIFSLHNANEIFLKHAFRTSTFTSAMLA